MRALLFNLALAALCIAPAFVSLVVAADKVENPFLKSTVGDWASYTQTIMIGKRPAKTTSKFTVKAKSTTEVTLLAETQMQGFKIPAQEMKIPLEGEFNPLDMVQGDTGLDIKYLETGEETVQVAGKSYKCKWQTCKIKGEIGGIPVDSPAKLWVSPEAPMGGLIRFESEVLGKKTVMELNAFGAAKK